jgi:DNA polymerase elongation subunit (family B)
MELYKWYSPNNLERYSLEYVSQFELGKGKLDYSEEAEDLRELYDADWNKYVDYNVIDCKRVNDLGQKLGYIRLVQSLSLLTRVPMRYYNAMTSLIEGLMLTYYRRNGLCAPTLQGGSQETFEAAYVKEPQKGMHKWLFSIDIQSSYPSHIITLNMSTETYYGRIMDMSEDEIISYMQKKEFQPFRMFNGYKVVDVKGSKLDKFNEAFKRKLFSIAPCGTLFLNTKKGVLSTVERNVFEKRIEIKKLMRQSEGEERGRYHSFQWSLKILLNALFGATSVPYSRYFNQDISEAITSCGRYTIKAGERYTNELLNKPNDELKTVLAELNKLEKDYD